MSVKPSLQALWLADEVNLNDDGKVTVGGMFDEITVRSGEDFTTRAYLFFSLRDIHGRVSLRLTYTNLNDNDVLLERTFNVTGEPLQTTDIKVLIDEIPVPHAGSYVWELFHGDDQLGSTRVEAKVV